MSLYESVRKRVPPLKLTRNDALELRELGDQFVQETLAQYLQLQVERRGVVDKTRWNEIRHRDDIRVYAERKSSALKSTPMKGHLGEPSDCSSNSSSGTTASSTTNDSRALPPLLVAGTVVGDLDDVMYATITPTADAVQIKTAYVDDGVVAAKILQQIIAPTPGEPFRNLAVKWCVVHPAKVQSLCRPRDYTYVDSSGIVIAPSGERIGFRITHSIAFPDFPTFEKHGVVRGNTSICALYRQSAPNIVDCFVTGFFDLCGSMTKRLALRAIAEQAMSFAKQVHCAQMKKLAWRLHTKPKVTTIASPEQYEAAIGFPDACKVCARSFASSRTGRFSLGPITKRCCSLCQALVCSKCRVKQRLHLMGRGHMLIHHELPFCSPCITETVRMDAYEIAKQEFATRDAYEHAHSASVATWSRSSRSSSSGRLHPMLASIVSSTHSVEALEFSEDELSDDDEDDDEAAAFGLDC